MPDTHLVPDFALNKAFDEHVSQIHVDHNPNFDASVLDSQFSFLEALEWGKRTLDSNHYEDVHC